MKNEERRTNAVSVMPVGIRIVCFVFVHAVQYSNREAVVVVRTPWGSVWRVAIHVVMLACCWLLSSSFMALRSVVPHDNRIAGN